MFKGSKNVQKLIVWDQEYQATPSSELKLRRPKHKNEKVAENMFERWENTKKL